MSADHIRWKSRGAKITEVSDLPPDLAAEMRGENLDEPPLVERYFDTFSGERSEAPKGSWWGGPEHPRGWNKSTNAHSHLYKDTRKKYGKWYLEPGVWNHRKTDMPSVWDDRYSSIDNICDPKGPTMGINEAANMLGFEVRNDYPQMARIKQREQDARKAMKNLFSTNAYREFLIKRQEKLPEYLL